MEPVSQRIKNWIELYDEYLNDQFEFPDEAQHNYSLFLAEKREILKCVGLSYNKPYIAALLKIIDDNLYQKEIAPNLFRLSINNSAALTNQIIKTLESFGGNTDETQMHQNKIVVGYNTSSTILITSKKNNSMLKLAKSTT